MLIAVPAIPLACAGRSTAEELPTRLTIRSMMIPRPASPPPHWLFGLGKANLAGSIVSQCDQEASKIDFTTLCPASVFALEPN
jgi:hypothetical protein